MRISIVDWTHQFLMQYVKEGDICIDATVGNGGDMLFLARLVGEQGSVTGFDIQQIALDHTREKLEQHGVNGTLYLDSHANMAEYFEPESVAAIVFNLGYLPGGDHKLATKGDSTIQAMEAGLSLLKKGGVISLCIYSGGDSGFEEKEAVLAYLKELDHRKYLVITNEFYNKPNHPPMPVFIIKN
ncbi:16S rRNA (cytosine(1402)-N(4))-methyltransferase [Anaerostipes sp. 992a]|uniref:tRNA (mnm(5)s(2)U34)-methyltransferase n=1 Tax=Anaerostipes sp. 992a TaxID=1261637 RepID=UPI000952F5B4|nr:class I SAM-dependent methyltransferase [Anaerostipes sp. 992a]OLR62180.1 16S rRNA (cytosine(1402)-N(4))-methyltransferase [Anaerostipes sp. 992a]